MTLEEGAKALLALLQRTHSPAEAEAQVLAALRGAQLASYQEIQLAARFHAGPHGQGIDGFLAGLGRAIDTLEHQ